MFAKEVRKRYTILNKINLQPEIFRQMYEMLVKECSNMLYVHKFISGWLLPPGGIIVMLFLLCGFVLRNAADFVIL